jgi:hypothetical protein
VSKFQPGQEVYNINGRAGAYIARAALGHIVEPIYDSEEYEEPRHGEAETWREVFSKPPVERLQADIAELERQFLERNEKLRIVNESIRQAEQDATAARKRIKDQPDLTDLDLWLQGKITHILSLDTYRFEIGTVDDMLLKKEDYGRTSIRLLNLRVDPKANLYWVGIAAYSDGSSSQTRCRLATSKEHAIQLLADHLAQVERKGGNNESEIFAAARSLVHYGATIRADLQAQLDGQDRAAKLRSLEERRKSFNRAQEELALAEKAAGIQPVAPVQPST